MPSQAVVANRRASAVAASIEKRRVHYRQRLVDAGRNRSNRFRAAALALLMEARHARRLPEATEWVLTKVEELRDQQVAAARAGGRPVTSLKAFRERLDAATDRDAGGGRRAG